MQEDTAHQKYFTKPPLHFISCFFLDQSIETEYRRTAWRANKAHSWEFSDYGIEPTLASSSFNAYIDILLSGVVFLLVSIACYVNFGASLGWIVVCALAGVYYVLVIFVSLKNFLIPGPSRSVIRKLYNWCRRWYPTQVYSLTPYSFQKKKCINAFKVFGALLIALPIISLFANLTIDNLDIHEDSRRNFFINLLVVTLIHFCNFTQVNFKAFDI